jgi:hypothetical protein
MGVVAILIAIMLPSLASVRETAHQIVCRSNVRQIGYGIAMNADANKDAIPRTGTINGNAVAEGAPDDYSYETMTLRYGPDNTPTQFLVNRWDGLGLLFVSDYLPAPKLFYCPSHRGRNPYRDYADAWGSESGLIVGNYQYRGRGPTGTIVAGHPVMATRLSQIMPAASLVADGLKSQSDFNHQIGANILHADVSTTWFNDSSHLVSELLPKDNQAPSSSLTNSAWNEFDNSSLR